MNTSTLPTKTKRYASATLLSAALYGLLSVPALAAAWPGEEKVADALRQSMRQAPTKHADSDVGTFRVQVVLKEPGDAPVPAKSYQSKAGLEAVQQKVVTLQDKVFAERQVGSLETLTRYQSIFGFSAMADADAIRDLARMPEVAYIEPMPIFELSDNQSHPLANVDDLHGLGFTGDGVTIAIIDDGIDVDHPAFGGFSGFPNAKIVGGRDFADNDNNPNADCNAQSHGTSVAGVAAGNGGGVRGTAPDARIVMLKIQRAADGCGGDGFLRGDIAGAIDWAVTNAAALDIKVISGSFGRARFNSASACDNENPSTRNAINAAHAAGIPVLIASGNEGYCANIGSPACMTNAISVGAVYDAALGNPGFCVADAGNFSCNGQFNSGCNSQAACFDNGSSADQVTCYSNSAPILDILAPSNNAFTARTGGGTTSSFGGTSSATPFAAGVVAAMYEKNANLTPAQVRSTLINTGVGRFDGKSGLTKPRVDALAAINAVSGGGGNNNPNSCSGQCGGQAPGGCWCDAQCASFGDCCSDKVQVCGN